jgi:hypothetical protein
MSRVDNKKILESIQSLTKIVADNTEQIRADVRAVWKEVFALQDEMKIIKKQIAENQVIMDKYEILSSTCKTIQQQYNNIEQSRLRCHMEITGIHSSGINSKEQVKLVAFETLARYDKTLQICDIKEASKKLKFINRESSIVIDVEFVSYDVKVRVIKRKLQVDKDKPAVSIFVGHSLTPQNRNLFLQARKIAKTLHTRCYTIDGRTYMKNHEDLRGIQIKSDLDLAKIQSIGWSSFKMCNNIHKQQPNPSQS